MSKLNAMYRENLFLFVKNKRTNQLIRSQPQKSSLPPFDNSVDTDQLASNEAS